MKKKIILFSGLWSLVSGLCFAVEITAPKIEYGVKTGIIQTHGETTVVNDSGQKVTLIDSYIENRGDNFTAKNTEFDLGEHIFISAKSIDRNMPITMAKDVIYTACYGCDDFGNAWEISATKFTHNETDQVLEFKNPTFWIYDIPVFWFPYLEHPDPTVKRKSGLLVPDFNSTNGMGTQFNFPIFVAFSDTHDATITPSYLTGENPLLNIEHRLNARHMEFRTTGSYTRNKAGDNRWHIFNRDIIELGENMRANIVIEKSSDKTYLQKYNFYDDQPYLDSRASLELFGETGYSVLETHIFQELRTSSNFGVVPSGDILPSMRATYQTLPFYGETYARFNADFLSVVGDDFNNQRIIGDARIFSPWTTPMGNRFTASIGTRYDVYNFSNTLMVDNSYYTGVKTRFLPSGYLEFSRPLIKMGKDWNHILEPRVRATFMRRVSDRVFAQNNDSMGTLLSDLVLFSDNRFSGYDLWENGSYADYGVRYAVFDNDKSSGEIFFGQTYDFFKDIDTDPNSGFHDGFSDYVGRLSYNKSGLWNVNTRFRLNRNNMELRHIETGFGIGDNKTYLSLGHIYAAQFIDAHTLGDNTNEIRGGFGYFITERLGIRFNIIYDIERHTYTRHSGGLIYDHPCYMISLDYRKDNVAKYDFHGETVIKVQFALKITGEK